MSDPDPVIRSISDTALWTAVYRADETDRADALFRDPFARRLAGARGQYIAENISGTFRETWPWVTRTYLHDQNVVEQVRGGVDMVVNLAAGLDTRPYRLDLPASLSWVEVDLPDLLAYKEDALKGEKPACRLERIALDLADVPARRDLFKALGARARKVMVITEGLLIYFTRDEVGAVARDLAAPDTFSRWSLEVASPGLLQMLQKDVGVSLSAAGSPLKFGPEEGPEFFVPFGWRPIAVRSMLKSAARLRRLPWKYRILALLPESTGRQGSRPWSGVCLLGRG